MIAVYAMGEGLGHLTRVRAVQHTLGADPDQIIVLSASRHGADPRITGRLTVRPTEPADVLGALHEMQPDELWVDAFPAGLHGELNAVELPSSIGATRHLARLLRWDAYRHQLGPDPIRFDHTHLLEPVGREHRQHLERVSGDVGPLDLVDPPAELPAEVRSWFDALARPRWLVAHAGPVDEVRELVAYARDLAGVERVTPSIVVTSAIDDADLPTIDCYPAWPIFAMADRVVTAAGFNAMRQAQAVGSARHRFLPFPRRFDDQFERARRARSCTRPA